MKKCILFGVFAAAMAATAGTATIYSCNTVGVHRVTGSYSVLDVPAPFEKIGGGNIDLESLLYIDNLTTGDNVQILLDDPYGFFKVWSTVNLPAYNLAMFYPSSRTEPISGGSVSVNPPEASAFNVPRGAGIKLIRSNTSGDVYVMGQYTSARPTTTIAGAARSYLVNPTNEPFDLDTKLTPTVGVDSGDQIAVDDGETSNIYYFNKTGKDGKYWYVQVRSTVNGVEVTTTDYVSPKIPAGGSFTFKRRRNRAFTFSW